MEENIKLLIEQNKQLLKQNNQILIALSNIQEEIKRKKRKPKKKISIVGEENDNS